MAVFENWDLFNIRMHRKRHPQNELFTGCCVMGRSRSFQGGCLMRW
jgi:hypothetical protein